MAAHQRADPAKLNVSWMFMNGGGIWVPYGEEDNATLEAAFSKGETNPVDLGGLYEVNIPDRRQKRLSSSAERDVPFPPSLLAQRA